MDEISEHDHSDGEKQKGTLQGHTSIVTCRTKILLYVGRYVWR